MANATPHHHNHAHLLPDARVVGQDYVKGRTQYNSYSGSDIECFVFLDSIPVIIADIQAAIDANIVSKITGLNLLEKVRSNTRSPLVPLGTLQTLTVSSAASVGPVRRLGENRPVEYLTGARTIAGTLVFAMLNSDVFTTLMRYPQMMLRNDNLDGPDFVDNIPAFNVLIQGSNEYGAQGSGILVGVKLTNFGTTFSIDDLYTESTYNYVANHYIPFVDDYESALRKYQATKALSKALSEKALEQKKVKASDGHPSTISPAALEAIKGAGTTKEIEDKLVDHVLTFESPYVSFFDWAVAEYPHGWTTRQYYPYGPAGGNVDP